MDETPYRSRATLEAVADLHRRAHLATGVCVDMGVHGPIATLFGLTPARALPLPVDFIVAAAGG
jgi:hypothetical protein